MIEIFHVSMVTCYMSGIHLALCIGSVIIQPYVITSTVSQVYVKFTSDHTITGHGITIITTSTIGKTIPFLYQK